uniref:XK-related protein n=1 Tax=Ciona savignyi TaxID=51511 RepID=H2YGJ0_CIOSA
MDKKKSQCCYFPDIPTKWLLFIEFAFTFGTTIVYFADIVTDIITLRMYFIREWYYAFVISICFIVLPSILMAILEFQFLRKAYGKSVPWKMIILRTALNIPFQLTIIWYHCQLTYTYLQNWLDHIRGVAKKERRTTTEWYEPTTLERSRGASLSSLNELDNLYNNSDKMDNSSEVISSIPPVSRSMGSLAHFDNNVGHKTETSNWWKRLTREQWLTHLNKLKLSESMLESLPQLLINLYLIAYYQETHVIQYISAVLSY